MKLLKTIRKICNQQEDSNFSTNKDHPRIQECVVLRKHFFQEINSCNAWALKLPKSMRKMYAIKKGINEKARTLREIACKCAGSLKSNIRICLFVLQFVKVYNNWTRDIVNFILDFVSSPHAK